MKYFVNAYRKVKEWFGDMFSYVTYHFDFTVALSTSVLVLGIVFILVLIFQPRTTVIVSGTVVDKIYQEGETKTGTGVGISSNGNPVTVTTSSTTPEKRKIIVLSNGVYDTYSVSINVYYSAKIDEHIQFECKVGNWIPIRECR